MKELKLPPIRKGKEGSGIRKVLLFCYNKNLHWLNVAIMWSYGAVRKCAHKFGKGG